jgi:hypothetical protein
MTLRDRQVTLMRAAIASVALTAVSAWVIRGDETEWISLIGERGLKDWRSPSGAWLVAGDATLDSRDRTRLAAVPGRGVLVNGPTGRTSNLLSSRDFGDIEAHLEFFIPEHSNSGVKLQGLYEIQIADTHASKKLSGSDCGGVYPRAELLPRYHHLDDGFAPRTNAARPGGQWQSLDLVFRAPRFDESGRKVADARFERVLLNGQVVQENVELRAPTGHAWRLPEVRRGPLLLQADHGPVAFRNIRVRAME